MTKFRHTLFGDRHLTRLEEIMRTVRADFECELVEFNGEDEHVHLQDARAGGCTPERGGSIRKIRIA